MLHNCSNSISGAFNSSDVAGLHSCLGLILRIARKLGSVRDLASVIQIQVNLSPALERTR